MHICQIIGYKNSGKTTVMKQLIHYFSTQDLKVGSLKHHGHGGEPDMVWDTDSSKHFTSGSMMSGVQGSNITQFMLHNEPKLELNELIQMYTFFPINILLIEGYKQADFPKIVLIKNKEDLSLLDELSNIIAVGTWNENLVENLTYPTFTINNMEAYIPQLVKYMTD